MPWTSIHMRFAADGLDLTAGEVVRPVRQPQRNSGEFAAPAFARAGQAVLVYGATGAVGSAHLRCMAGVLRAERARERPWALPLAGGS